MSSISGKLYGMKLTICLIIFAPKKICEKANIESLLETQYDIILLL
jgi:hypothetical protein